MKRVVSACLYQTLHFIPDPALPREEAIRKVQEEFTKYKAETGDRIQILEERHPEDGSVRLSIRKKVSGYPVGEYFDR